MIVGLSKFLICLHMISVSMTSANATRNIKGHKMQSAWKSVKQGSIETQWWSCRQIRLEVCLTFKIIIHPESHHWTTEQKQTCLLNSTCHYFFVNLEYDRTKVDMLSEDRNVKRSTVGMSHRLCECVVLWQGTGVPLRTGWYLWLPNWALSTQLVTSKNKLTGKRQHRSVNLSLHLFTAVNTCTTTSKEPSITQHTAECIFGAQSDFSRHVSVIIIPRVAHVWSQQAVEQHSARSAQSGMATEGWWGKQVLWSKPSECQRGRKETERRRRGEATATMTIQRDFWPYFSD